MSVYQPPLKPAYSGVGAPASTTSSPAPMPTYGQHIGAPIPTMSQEGPVPPPSYTSTPSMQSPEIQPRQQLPQRSTFPPPKDGKHIYMQPPIMAYSKSEHPLPEKPLPEITSREVHSHAHYTHSASGNKWTFGLFDCFSPLSTCCLGTWCPCLLYGRTYAREHGNGVTSGVGVMCCVWTCAACWGFYGCLQCYTRGSLRQRYGIDSNPFNDFCLSCCCSCCAMIQEEKESVVSTIGINPVTNVRYQRVEQGMRYPA